MDCKEQRGKYGNSKNKFDDVTKPSGIHISNVHSLLLNSYRHWNPINGKRILFINISDLIHCQRQLVLRKQSNVEPSLDYSSEALTKGKLFHQTIQEYLVQAYPDRMVNEKPVKYNCSSAFTSERNGSYLVYTLGRIDVFDKIDNTPWEIKTSFSKKEITKPRSYHIQQLKYYMAMTNSKEARLLYCQLGPEFNNDPFREFPITMTDEELYESHLQLIRESLKLASDISSRRAEFSNHVAYDPERRWLCNSCSFSQECLNMRIKANRFVDMNQR
jgi:CRISPR/Cas system-associated exonuclease Cas4 (RecB family)